MSTPDGKTFLFWFANEHLNFRIPELEALTELFKIPAQWVERNAEKPWIILNLGSEDDAKKILSRCLKGTTSIRKLSTRKLSVRKLTIKNST